MTIRFERFRCNAPGTQNLIKTLHFMFQSILPNLKSIGTCLVVKLRLIRIFKKLIISSKSIKHRFLQNLAISTVLVSESAFLRRCNIPTGVCLLLLKTFLGFIWVVIIAFYQRITRLTAMIELCSIQLRIIVRRK